MTEPHIPALALLGQPPFPPIEIDAEGGWSHRGRDILHPAILRELKRHLRREADGVRAVEIGGFRVPVLAEGPPYTILAVSLSEPASLWLDDGSLEPILPSLEFATTLRDRLVCAVKEGRDWALFARPAQQQLEPFLQQAGELYCFVIAGLRLPISRTPHRC